MRNAKLIHDELEKAGFSVSGGVNAPYIWLETPDKMTSWQFFDYLLKEAMWLALQAPALALTERAFSV